MTTTFKHVNEIFISLLDMLKPPEEMSVAQSACKHIYLNNPGAYVGPFRVSNIPYMRDPMNTFASHEFSGLIFVGSAQAGKALCVRTAIPTPTGWTTMGKLSVGDDVFNEKGEPCKVLLTSPVMFDHDVYDVCFDDNTSVRADAEHLWVVWDDKAKTAPRTLRTIDMVGNEVYRDIRTRFSIDNAKPLQTPHIDLPIDPYVLGVWLGDGSHAWCAVHINKDDTLIIDNIRARGYECEIRDRGQSHCYEVVVRSGLLKALGKLGLIRSNGNKSIDKHIPEIYQRASIEQRMELLRGLMDTDGTVCQRGKPSFTTIHDWFALDFAELLCGLGFKNRTSSCIPTFRYKGEKRNGQRAFDVSFTAYSDQAVFSLPRKQGRLGDRANGRPSYVTRRRITAIKKVKTTPVRCIKVDSPSSMFLAGRAMVPTHNTEGLILAPLTYSVKVEPLDIMLVCPTMLDGRDFSMRRIDRLHHYSEQVGEMLIPGGSNDNTYDKHYKNGLLFTIGWPTRSQLAGKPIPRVVLTDRDRMADDTEGDGEPFDLASQRTTTFGRYAMTVAESSPSREILNPKWIARTPHEAPPCTGIVGLYNRGDRRRWYWPCPSCETYFEGEFEMLTYTSAKESPDLTNLERAETVRMNCPHCGFKIHPDHREDMQNWGVWVKDGQGIDKNGNVFGPVPRTLIASFWLKGVAAAFTSWKKLVAQYLDANDDFTRTGSEEGLRKFYNNNLGVPYVSRVQADLRLPEVLKARAERGLPERQVPSEVRFLVAFVDVQKNMWRVDVFGIVPGKPFDIVVIDRYDVRKSARLDEQGDPLWVKPHAYQEDWDELIPHVIEKEYPVGDDSGRMMAIRMTVCDSGGKEGVTTRAYDFYRKLVSLNKHRRFMLYKGDPTTGNPRARISYPDSSRKDSRAGARGDIPVLMLNSNILKDDLSGRLECLEPGKGMIRFPDWLPDEFYAELCSEVRGQKGWENPSNGRNEDWDALYVTIGVCASELLRVEHLDWNNPPGWAATLDKNDLVRSAEEAPVLIKGVHSQYNFAEMAKALA